MADGVFRILLADRRLFDRKPSVALAEITLPSHSLMASSRRQWLKCRQFFRLIFVQRKVSRVRFRIFAASPQHADLLAGQLSAPLRKACRRSSCKQYRKSHPAAVSSGTSMDFPPFRGGTDMPENIFARRKLSGGRVSSSLLSSPLAPSITGCALAMRPTSVQSRVVRQSVDDSDISVSCSLLRLWRRRSMQMIG
jgi:hypothetical protein